jgi:putative NIF3 family GTP cyclohydrolase 1 type 2
MGAVLKVGEIVSMLRAKGAHWTEERWDGLQSGTLDVPVTGIAVVWSPELPLLRNAVALGCNLILCKDPLYWFEDEGPLKADFITSRISEGTTGPTAWDVIEKTELYRMKRDFVADNKLNVYRLSQNWDGGKELATTGFLRTLAWTPTESFVADDRYPYTRTAFVQIPTKNLIQVAAHAKRSLGAKSTRLLGDRSARVTKVAVHPGYLTLPAALRIGEVPGLDAILTGETCEWEAFVYAEDWISSGHGKGLIMTGLAVASDTAARELASWISTFIPTKIKFFAAGDPFTPIYAGGLRA